MSKTMTPKHTRIENFSNDVKSCSTKRTNLNDVLSFPPFFLFVSSIFSPKNEMTSCLFCFLIPSLFLSNW